MATGKLKGIDKPGRDINFDAQVGMNLSNFRRAKGVTQMRLAKEWGVEYQMVQKHESGRTPLTLWRAHKAAKLLEFQLHDLIKDTGEM